MLIRMVHHVFGEIALLAVGAGDGGVARVQAPVMTRSPAFTSSARAGAPSITVALSDDF